MERLARPRRPQDKLVAVGDDATLHRKIRDVQVQRLAADAVAHLDPERTARRLVVRLLGEETQRRLDERVERLLGRKVPGIARNTRPVECRGVHRIVARPTLHQGKLAAHIVADAPQFLGILTPRQHIEMCADRGQTERVRLVQILVDPLLVDLVRPRIPRERVHTPGLLLEAPKVLGTVIQKQPLVVDVIAEEQQPDRRGKRQQAIRAIRREALVAHIRADTTREILRIGKRVQTDMFVPDTEILRTHRQILQRRRIVERQGEIFLDKARSIRRADDLLVREAGERNETRIIDDALELFHGFKELRSTLPIDILWDDMTPAQRREVRLHPGTLLCGLGQIQIADVIQERTLVEMLLERPT